MAHENAELLSEIVSNIGLSTDVIDSKRRKQFKIQTVEFPKGAELFKPGDACKLFLVVLSGIVRVELTTKNGRVLTLYKIDSGESCILTTSALLNDERYYTRGITESEVTAIAISSPDFHEALSAKPEFAKYVLEGFSTRISSIVGLVDRMATRDVSTSIAEYLLEHHEERVIDVTQKDLAMEIGTAREVISRKLSDLESQGMIRRDRGVIYITDMQALQKI